MKVLVGCERSGVVRRALRALGHDAWSCDLEPADDCSGFHIQGDVLGILNDNWDLGIFHPVCRYLSNSGAKHLWLGMKRENGPCPVRFANMVDGAAFFLKCWHAPIPKVVVENPVIHGHAQAIIKDKPTQIIQPWQHGHKETKATCLWLRELDELVPTDIVGPPPDDPEERKTWAVVHRMPPGPDRERLRSETYSGIASAFADQWAGAA